MGVININTNKLGKEKVQNKELILIMRQFIRDNKTWNDQRYIPQITTIYDGGYSSSVHGFIIDGGASGTTYVGIEPIDGGGA